LGEVPGGELPRVIYWRVRFKKKEKEKTAGVA